MNTQNNPPRGSTGHRYAYTTIHPYVAMPPVPYAGPYYPDSSAGYTHQSPDNAETLYPTPYTGPAVVKPVEDPP